MRYQIYGPIYNHAHCKIIEECQHYRTYERRGKAIAYTPDKIADKMENDISHYK